MRKHSKKTAICKPRTGASGETSPAHTLISDFQPPGLGETKACSLSQSVVLCHVGPADKHSSWKTSLKWQTYTKQAFLIKESHSWDACRGLSQLSLQLLISAQVMIPGSWDRVPRDPAPHRAPCWAWSLLGILSPSAPFTCLLYLKQTNNNKKQTNKRVVWIVLAFFFSLVTEHNNWASIFSMLWQIAILFSKSESAFNLLSFTHSML